MKVFRWLMCAPAALVGYITGYLAGVLVYQIGEWTCPPEYVVSGMCSAPWSQSLFSVALSLGASVAASLIVALPALTAPSNRHAVAVFAFVLGSLFAAYSIFTLGTAVLGPAAAAIASGTASLLGVHAKLRRSNNLFDTDAQACRSDRR